MQCRNWLSVVAALATPFLVSSAMAQTWPSRPIKLMVPFPPDGLIKSKPGQPEVKAPMLKAGAAPAWTKAQGARLGQLHASRLGAKEKVATFAKMSLN